MPLSLSEIISSLPSAADKPGVINDPNRELMERLAQRPVPTGMLCRLWTLGTLQAKIAAGYFSYWIRSGFRSDDEQDRLRNEAHLTAAVQLLGGMSYLRGIIMKAGQTLANYPRLAPSEFVDTLSHLNFEAPPMHFALLREMVRGELGADVEEVFAEFDPCAFAAASLGQVHRARLRSGVAVVVKVQYPGIAETIRSDYRSMLGLLTPMRLTKDWDSIRAQVDDIRQMMEAETDYLREAENLKRARSVFQPADGIIIPKVIEEYSSRRVLTMEFLDGMHMDRYLAANPTPDERDRYGELMMRASFRIAHAARLWYADSHPGNYLFLPDGRLGVIDFGCCREFTSEEWDYYKQIWKVYVYDDGAGLREAMIRGAELDTSGPLDEAHLRFLTEYSHWWSDYIRFDTPFDFGDDVILQRGIDYMSEIAKKGYFRSKPVNVWITRQLLGLRSLLYKLKARVNMRKLALEEEWNIMGAD